MTTKTEINKIREEIKNLNISRKENLWGSKLYSYCSLIGVLGLSYLGARYLCGARPDPDIIGHYHQARTFIQNLDDAAIGSIGISLILLPVSLIEYGVSFSAKKEIRRKESELKELIEGYKFERGHL